MAARSRVTKGRSLRSLHSILFCSADLQNVFCLEVGIRGTFVAALRQWCACLYCWVVHECNQSLLFTGGLWDENKKQLASCETRTEHAWRLCVKRRDLETEIGGKKMCVCVLWTHFCELTISFSFSFAPKKKSISKKSNDKKAGHLSDAVLLIERLFHPQFTIAVAGKVDLRLNSGLQTLLASRKVEKKHLFLHDCDMSNHHCRRCDKYWAFIVRF